MENLDMHLNFTMTDMSNSSHLGGIATEGLYGGIIDDQPLSRMHINHSDIPKKKKTKKKAKKIADQPD